MLEVSRNIQDEITSIGIPEKARWLENYIKHQVKSKGVGIPEIRKILLRANKQFQLMDKSVQHQIEILNDLMLQEYAEDKLAAILYLQLFWKGTNEEITLELVSNWFDEGLITDWNICDWLCVRILSPMVDNMAEITLLELSQWNNNKNLWKARASLVPFAQSKTIAKHTEMIKEFSTVLIKREERFCKTAVGWVLREYSKVDSNLVTTFLEEHKDWVTKEVGKNATKYLS